LEKTKLNRVKNSKLIILVLFTLAAVTSCAPTYTRETMVDGVIGMCKKEYGVDVEVKVEGKTLGVRIPLEGLFDKETLQPTPEAFKKVDGVMLSVSRVVLSSDKSIDFHTVITYDKGVPGVELVITRYAKDLRRFVYGDISRGEFTKRMFYDLRYNPQGIIDAWLGAFTLKEVKPGDFIIDQATRRITEEFRDNEMLIGKFKLAACEGNLEAGRLKFTVDITREGLPMSELIHGKAWHDQVLELCLQKISYTVHAYNFKDYEVIEVFNKFDNNRVEIGKNEINRWRKKGVKID